MLLAGKAHLIITLCKNRYVTLWCHLADLGSSLIVDPEEPWRLELEVLAALDSGRENDP